MARKARRAAPAPPAQPPPRRRRWLRWLLLWLPLTVLLTSVLLVLPLRWFNPPGSMVMWQRQLEAPADAPLALRWRWCDYAQLGSLPRAVIAAEDQRFLQHHGFDLVELQKALEAAEEGGRLRGASTISQQVAKNLYLSTHRSWLRKGGEAWFTLWLEAMLSKRRILELHLNIAEWGPGVFGACAATEYWYGLSPQQLNTLQAARLAATLPAPLQRSPSEPGEYTVRRAAWIIEQMPRVAVP